MEFTGKDIPPDISEEENIRNVENFINVLYRLNKVKNYSHCSYSNGELHIYIEKNK